MKTVLVALSLIVVVVFFSCGPRDPNKEVEEGSVSQNLYTSKEIGWTMEIPDGWEIVSKDKAKENTEKGMDLVEKTVEQDIDYSGLKHLISFKKNAFNNFMSTSEPFELEYEGEWEENNKVLREVLYSTYINQGINADTVSSFETIDGLAFNVFKVTIYSPKGDTIMCIRIFSKVK